MMEFCRNKWTTFRGNPLFPFLLVGTEITVHLHKISISILLLALTTTSSFVTRGILINQWDWSFSPAWKKTSLLTRKFCEISNRKSCLNGCKILSVRRNWNDVVHREKNNSVPFSVLGMIDLGDFLRLSQRSSSLAGDKGKSPIVSLIFATVLH